MKLKYLGTAAYEGVPSLFCDCAVCRKSKRTGGKNLRSRSQALVNDDLLIDFPADTVWHSHAYGLDWNSITDCIITHSHSDHLYAADTAMLAEGYGKERANCISMSATAVSINWPRSPSETASGNECAYRASILSKSLPRVMAGIRCCRFPPIMRRILRPASARANGFYTRTIRVCSPKRFGKACARSADSILCRSTVRAALA